MYQQFYGFESRPFESSIEPNHYFLGRTQRHIVTLVHNGLQQGRGLVVLTGSSGIGKTSFANFFIKEQKNSRFVIGKISAKESDDLGLLYLILSGFKQKILDYKTPNLFSQVESFVQSQLDRDMSPLLIIDDAHKLNDQNMDVLQRLVQFKNEGKLSFQVMLIGDDKLNDRLDYPANKLLKDTIVSSGKFEPMQSLEIKKYVEHRLKRVGWIDTPVISVAVVREAQNETGGIPSKINFHFNRFLNREMYRLSELRNRKLDSAGSGSLSDFNAHNLVSLFGQLHDEYQSSVEKTKVKLASRFDFLKEKKPPHSPFEKKSTVTKSAVSESWFSWQTAGVIVSSYLLSVVIAGSYYYFEEPNKNIKDKVVVAENNR